MTVPDPPKAAAVVFAVDLSGMADFYAAIMDAGGERQDGFSILELPGFQLVIHQIPVSVAQHINIASPPVRRTENPVKLVFPVASIAAARERAARFGGQIDPPEHEWQFRGSAVCDGHDPEGNVLQLREPAR